MGAAMGKGWAQRTAASAMGFGVGRIKEEIQLSSDRITIKTTNPPPLGNVENSLQIDGKEQYAKDPEGTEVRACLKWEGDSLVSSTKNMSKEPLASTRRSMQGETMTV